MACSRVSETLAFGTTVAKELSYWWLVTSGGYLVSTVQYLTQSKKNKHKKLCNVLMTATIYPGSLFADGESVCLSDSFSKHSCISILKQWLQSWFYLTIWIHCRLHSCELAKIPLLSCLCWHIAVFCGAQLPRVDQDSKQKGDPVLLVCNLSVHFWFPRDTQLDSPTTNQSNETCKTALSDKFKLRHAKNVIHMDSHLSRTV